MAKPTGRQAEQVKISAERILRETFSLWQLRELRKLPEGLAQKIARRNLVEKGEL